MADDALRIACLLAIDPARLGGAIVRGGPGGHREAWLAALKALLAPGAPLRSVPRQCDDDRLLGGLDFARTLALRRPVFSPGLLTEADGGVLVLHGSERMEPTVAARVTGAMDRGHVVSMQHGRCNIASSRFAAIVLDEGRDTEDMPPAALADRVAFRLDLDSLSRRPLVVTDETAARVAVARASIDGVVIDGDLVDAICNAAAALGIESLRAPMHTLCAARCLAALAGREKVDLGDAQAAVQLVLAPRARQNPADVMSSAEPPIAEPSDEPPPQSGNSQSNGDEATPEEDANRLPEAMAELLVAAAAAVLPEGAFVGPMAGRTRGAGTRGGRTGSERLSKTHGRPVGARRGSPRGGARLALIETLRAAVPWQAIRRNGAASLAIEERTGVRIEVRPQDLHVKKLKRHAETATIFLVDASGSSAFNRMAEAKGAVELLLSRCYARRDCVALISFRGKQAQLVLPPTHALARAKRLLGSCVGGGGTPLATALDLALETAEMVRRKGQQPTLVVLTDGRANVCRDGSGDRVHAAAEADLAARAIRNAGVDAILIDTSPQPRTEAARIAAAAGGRYIPLPHARADKLAAALSSGPRGVL